MYGMKSPESQLKWISPLYDIYQKSNLEYESAPNMRYKSAQRVIPVYSNDVCDSEYPPSIDNYK